ncbi:MAG: dUTP diphosphatase [Bacilli bacterium]|jgi:dUTP pyrophosphatase
MGLNVEEKKEIFKEFQKELIKAKQVYVEVCRENVKLPQYNNIGDAGMDIRAAEDIILLPGETKIIPTGLKMVIPKGYEIQVRPRSGISLKHPLRIANSPGTIDSGYRDEIGIIMSNILPKRMFEKGDISSSFFTYIDDKEYQESGIYKIRKGDRIAQIILTKVETIEFVPIQNIKDLGVNRGGGFGSTGIK